MTLNAVMARYRFSARRPLSFRANTTQTITAAHSKKRRYASVLKYCSRSAGRSSSAGSMPYRFRPYWPTIKIQTSPARGITIFGSVPCAEIETVPFLLPRRYSRKLKKVEIMIRLITAFLAGISPRNFKVG